VWRSTFVPEFHIRPVSNTLVTVISFSQISRCHKGSNYTDKENRRCAFSGQIGAVTKQSALTPCHGESTTSGSARLFG